MFQYTSLNIIQKKKLNITVYNTNAEILMAQMKCRVNLGNVIRFPGVRQCCRVFRETGLHTQLVS